MALPATRIVLDSEAVAHCPEGLPDFHALLGRSGAATACLYAFDLLHVGRDDLRTYELVERRALLRKYLRGAEPALLYSQHMEGDEGEAMFCHACRLGLEGIVSKRATSPYKSAPLSWDLAHGAEGEITETDDAGAKHHQPEQTVFKNAGKAPGRRRWRTHYTAVPGLD